MRRAVHRIVGCVGGSILGVGAMRAAPAPATLIPLQQFAAGPQMEAPGISPDGQRLVYITTIGGERFVVVRDLHSGDMRPVIRGTSDTYRVTRCHFKNDNRLLCAFEGLEGESRRYPASRLVALNADGSHVRLLFRHSFTFDEPERGQYQDRIVHWLPADPRHVLIALADRDDIFPGVYRLDVESGDTRLVVLPHPPVMKWIADRDGVVRFGSGYRDQTMVYVARHGPNDSWRTLEKFKRFGGAHFEPLAFGPLPNQLFVAAAYERRAAVWEMDLDENRDFQLVFSRPDVDAGELLEWPTDRHVTGFEYETDRPHAFFIDPLAAAVDRALDKAVPDSYHLLLDASRDGQKLLAMSYSDVKPPRYHLLDVANHTLTLIGMASADLEHAQLAPVKTIAVPGADGTSIPGYLTLPLGRAPEQRLPAVVFPHGGPYTRDHWGYGPLVQLMANRGYAVLQLNFRGSTGYGEAWREAGHQGWGTIMHEDITAGAHWLIEQGIADPARMCIVGWSYGGYAALIGVVKEPQLYRCAVSIAGVSDLSQLARDDDRFYGGRDAVLFSTGTDKTKLRDESPVLHADRISVPVLMVHGENDYTVLPAQSRAMAKALSQHGIRNELVLIKDGEHSLLRPDMRLALYGKLEAFLAANTGSR